MRLDGRVLLAKDADAQSSEKIDHEPASYKHERESDGHDLGEAGHDLPDARNKGQANVPRNFM